MWIGQAGSAIGSHSTAIAMPLLVLAITQSPAKAGLVGFVGTATQVALLPVAGVVADQVNRRQLMRWCDAGRALAMAVVAMTLLVGRPPLAELMGVALINGSLTAFFTAAHSGALRHVVAPTDLHAAVARIQAYRQAAAVGGPPLGGLLYGIARLLPFLTDALSYLVSYLAISAIRIPLHTQHRHFDAAFLRRRLLDGLRLILGEPFLRASCLYAAVLCFLSPAVILTVIVRATTAGASSWATGMIFGVSGAGGVIGALASPRICRRWSPRVLLLATGATWAGAIPLLAGTTQPILLGFILATLGFVTPSVNTTIISYQMNITPDRLQGQTHAAMSLITGLPAPLGSLTGGAMLAVIGPLGSIFILTAIAAGTVLLGSASPGLRTRGRLHNESMPPGTAR
jgi:MFS family permease